MSRPPYYCQAHGTYIPLGHACVDCIAGHPPRVSLAALQDINMARAARWHVHGGLAGWSPLEWAGAMCGEAGEAANFAKKLKRVESELQNQDGRLPDDGRSWISTEELAARYRTEIGKECADTILYALLLMARVGVNAETAIRDVFNTKSEEYGFPERI